MNFDPPTLGETVSKSPVVGRLAPSPTGAQHLGNARTFCLVYWATRSAGGELKLRIEDIDTPRIKVGAAAQAIEDLRWLGISWDGPTTYQTDRRERYLEILKTLQQQNVVYPCICTRRDIENAGSAPHFEHESPIYAGTCSGWRFGDDVPGDPHCWRFRTDSNEVQFDDLCAGQQRCCASTHLGDFPITQKTGDAAYQLAVVVDDHDAGINHVIRGDDLLVSTFRQILIHRSLAVADGSATSWPIPRYAHVPLVVGADGHRLAKRHGDTRLSQYRENGLPPIEIVRWAARSSGLIRDDDPPIHHIDEMIERFDWSKINRHATIAPSFSPNG